MKFESEEDFTDEVWIQISEHTDEDGNPNPNTAASDPTPDPIPTPLPEWY